MIPYREGGAIANTVIDPKAVGFSQEAIELIQSSLVIGPDIAVVEAFSSSRGLCFGWVGTPTMPLPASLLTITPETLTFDFSLFQQIPNDVPGYSVWLRRLGLEPHAEHHAR